MRLALFYFTGSVVVFLSSLNFVATAESADYASMEFAELNAAYSNLADTLRNDSAAYRDSSPVFKQYYSLCKDKVIPLLEQGEVAQNTTRQFSSEEQIAFKKSTQQIMESPEFGTIPWTLFVDLAVDTVAFLGVDSHEEARATKNHYIPSLYAMATLVKQEDAPKKHPNPLKNPHKKGSMEALAHDQMLMIYLSQMTQMFKSILIELPDELTAQSRQLEEVYALLEKMTTPDEKKSLPLKYVDAYTHSFDLLWEAVQKRLLEATRSKQTLQHAARKKAQADPNAFLYTLTTTKDELILIVFTYNAEKELTNIEIHPPEPAGSDDRKTIDDIILAKDGTEIRFNTKWTRGNKPEMQAVSTHSPTPTDNSIKETSYTLPSNEGHALIVMHGWNNGELVNIEIQEALPRQGK